MKRLLEISWDKRAIFLERPNRFLGICQDPSTNENLKVHVRDPGRLRELLFKGNEVLLKRSQNPKRKTRWDLVAARSMGKWVLVNSGYHSAIASLIFNNQEISPVGQVVSLKREVKVGKSRLDFLLFLEKGEKIYIEVKGCTLQKNGKALFPDAPTQRGRRHLLELADVLENGFRSAVVFLIFCPQAECFDANGQTDPSFYETFYQVIEKGVEVYPICLEYKGSFVWYKKGIGLCMD